jgi:hypothetical protein
MTTARYSDEFDENNVLRDGKAVRVSMQVRDAALLRQVNTRPRITDGRTNHPMSLHQPGFRIRAGDTRQAVRNAYRDYETGLVNAYRCGDGIVSDGAKNDREEGSGYGNGNEGGYDSRNRAVNLDQHRQVMDRLYRERDAADQNAWRNG